MRAKQPEHRLFRRPVEVLEVWRSVRLFEKNETPATERHAPVNWTPFDVGGGAVRGPELLLDAGAAARVDLKSAILLLLVADHPSGNHPSYQPAGLEAFVSPRRLKLDIVGVDTRGDWPLYLSLSEYSLPRRDRFQAATLVPGKTVELRVNEKSDGYHQRMYIEYSYLLRRSGPFTEAIVLDGPFPVIPPSDRQLVDLRKPLW